MSDEIERIEREAGIIIAADYKARVWSGLIKDSPDGAHLRLAAQLSRNVADAKLADAIRTKYPKEPG